VSDASKIPPGWYPDSTNPGGQRWWDGTQWTEHAQAPGAPYQPFAELKAPDGTKTGTVWVWLIVLLPLLSIFSLFSIDFTGYMQSVLSNPYSTGAMLALYTSPGYLLTLALSFVLYGLTVLFAALDVRELTKRQVPKPFHWAFAFLGGYVYVIGRSVVVRRRTGGGLAPLWGLIAVFVVSMIVSIVWSIILTQSIFSMIPSYVPVS
jgi:hypothetical protein